HSIEGHDAFFWSAGDLAEGMARAGLSEITVTTFPTPWLFLDKLGAYWFINELFGLDLDPEERRTGHSAATIIDRNLTIRSDADHAIVDWQLLYATGVKRGRRGRSESADSPSA
ncbi:MAG: hypothetical protein HOV83_23600, partial [Catenulispora sp.]|nr:hypothetical protein [Catenulispora sp.]